VIAADQIDFLPLPKFERHPKPSYSRRKCPLQIRAHGLFWHWFRPSTVS